MHATMYLLFDKNSDKLNEDGTPNMPNIYDIFYEYGDGYIDYCGDEPLAVYTEPADIVRIVDDCVTYRDSYFKFLKAQLEKECEKLGVGSTSYPDIIEFLIEHKPQNTTGLEYYMSRMSNIIMTGGRPDPDLGLWVVDSCTSHISKSLLGDVRRNPGDYIVVAMDVHC